MGAGIEWVTQAAGLAMQYQANQEEQINKDLQTQKNISLANAAAADAVARGNREAAITRMKGDQQQGALRSAYATSNVDTSVGTPVQAAAQNAYFTELDAKTAENNALREAWGFKTYGTQYAQQAAIDAARTNNKQAATILGGVRDFAGTAARGIRASSSDETGGDSSGYGGD